jgi:formyl-CoA transferase
MRGKPQAFESINHSKEIVQIDLGTEQGQAQTWELFEQADIFVDNMRPGVLERFGFGKTALRQKKPSLIHCAVSGYGHGGDWANRPTFDHVVQAALGMLAALGILAAILRRDLTGAGESIDVSMMGAADVHDDR